MPNRWEFHLPATERLAGRRRVVAVIEQWIFSKAVRNNVILDLVAMIAGIIGYFLFGPIALLVSLLAAVLLVLVVVGHSMQVFRGIREFEGPVPPGSGYTGQFGAEALRLTNPQGRIDRIPYHEVSRVHQMGEFVVFTAIPTGKKVVYPKGVFPGGSSRWLKEFVSNYSKTDPAS